MRVGSLNDDTTGTQQHKDNISFKKEGRGAENYQDTLLIYVKLSKNKQKVFYLKTYKVAG